RMRNPIIVALDVPSLDEARALASELGDSAGALKVGLELFNAFGPDAVREFQDTNVMLDLKLHDIPTTVGRAIKSLQQLRVALLSEAFPHRHPGRASEGSEPRRPGARPNSTRGHRQRS